jgi:hypothetical protein
MGLGTSAGDGPARPRHADAKPHRPALLAAGGYRHRGADFYHRLRPRAVRGLQGQMVGYHHHADHRRPVVDSDDHSGDHDPRCVAAERRVDHRRFGAVRLAALCARRPQCCHGRARQRICPGTACARGRGLAHSAAVRRSEHPAADRVRRGARRRAHDDFRGHPRLPGIGDPAADAEFRQHDRGFPQVSDQRVVDRHHTRHISRRRADVDQSHGVGAREGPQPDLWRSPRWISRSFSKSAISPSVR